MWSTLLFLLLSCRQAASRDLHHCLWKLTRQRGELQPIALIYFLHLSSHQKMHGSEVGRVLRPVSASQA